MNVLVYAAGIHRGGGPANHLRRFLLTLSTIESAHEWSFIVNSEFPVPEEVSSRIRITPLPVHGALSRMYQDFWRQRVDIHRSHGDVLLNLADFGPLPQSVPIITFQRNPNYYDDDLLGMRNGLDRLQWGMRRRLAHFVVRRSRRVLCPSRTMADKVLKTVAVPPSRVHTLQHPFDHVAYGSIPWRPAFPARILYVGHLMPHKNHQWLVRVFAMSGLARDGVELWMTAAREDWPEGYDGLLATAQQHNVLGALRLLGRVPPHKVRDLYLGSTLFVFASRGESFGFPLVEALACGTPTLALDTPIAREICGEHARFLPSDVKLAGQVLRAALTAEGSDLERWSQASRARAREFCLSWPDWLRRLEGEIDDVSRART
jgi:glycosyltransferase involved in cell wall biosynthesis